MTHDRRTDSLAQVLAILACLLAISSVLGNDASQREVTAAVDASNAYNWFQAKTIRERIGEIPGGISRDELRAQGDMHSAKRAEASRQSAIYSVAQAFLAISVALLAAAMVSEARVVVWGAGLAGIAGAAAMAYAIRYDIAQWID